MNVIHSISWSSREEEQSKEVQENRAEKDIDQHIKLEFKRQKGFSHVLNLLSFCKLLLILSVKQ